jgi:hypothetical protein
MKATVSAILQETKFWREETKAYPEKRKVNSEEMKSVAEHPEVLIVEAAEKTVRALRSGLGTGI